VAAFCKAENCPPADHDRLATLVSQIFRRLYMTEANRRVMDVQNRIKQQAVAAAEAGADSRAS